MNVVWQPATTSGNYLHCDDTVLPLNQQNQCGTDKPCQVPHPSESSFQTPRPSDDFAYSNNIRFNARGNNSCFCTLKSRWCLANKLKHVICLDLTQLGKNKRMFRMTYDVCQSATPNVPWSVKATKVTRNEHCVQKICEFIPRFQYNWVLLDDGKELTGRVRN